MNYIMLYFIIYYILYILYIIIYIYLFIFIYIYTFIRIYIMYINIYIYIYIYIYIFASIFRKWKIFHQCLLIPQNGKTELIFFISLHFCLYFPELENISSIHFTSRKWKKLKWFSILPNGKKYQIEKLKNMFISTKWKKWSNFLYFSTNWTSFPQSGKHFIIAIYFHEMQKKLSNFLYFFIHISFHFHEVDYISPMRFISTK